MSIWLTFKRHITWRARTVFQGRRKKKLTLTCAWAKAVGKMNLAKIATVPSWANWIASHSPLSVWKEGCVLTIKEQMGFDTAKNNARLKPQTKTYENQDKKEQNILFSAVQKNSSHLVKTEACCVLRSWEMQSTRKAWGVYVIIFLPPSPPSHKTRQVWPPCVRPDPLLQIFGDVAAHFWTGLSLQ